jgi:hypothetical protein
MSVMAADLRIHTTSQILLQLIDRVPYIISHTCFDSVARARCLQIFTYIVQEVAPGAAILWQGCGSFFKTITKMSSSSVSSIAKSENNGQNYRKGKWEGKKSRQTGDWVCIFTRIWRVGEWLSAPLVNMRTRHSTNHSIHYVRHY